MFDLDQSENGVHNPDSFYRTPLKYSDAYIERNGGRVAEINDQWRADVRDLIDRHGIQPLNAEDYSKISLNIYRYRTNTWVKTMSRSTPDDY